MDEQKSAYVVVDDKRMASVRSAMEDVASLVDSLRLGCEYQRDAIDARNRLRAVLEVLAENGCDCDCDHYPDEHGGDCDLCLACRIEDVIRK